MRNILKYTILFLVSIVLFSCGKDGCTDPSATNYNPDAKNNDNSCVILDCMDPNAINYNPKATDDNGTCTYSTSYLLSGSWNILNIEYTTQIDFPIPILGSQTISGEANDAGNWTFLYPEQTCSNTLNFVTEGIDFSGITLPGFPIDMTSEGTWELSNNENNLLVTDQNTNLVSDYQILSVQENVCFLSGTIPFVIDTMGFTINSEIDIELQLSK